MNWDYIAGFFDGEGNINLLKNKQHQKTMAYYLIVSVRIYQNSKEVLQEIKEFIACGSIYRKKETGVFELHIYKKREVKFFLLNIRDKIIVKKQQVEYLLNFYNFENVDNCNFDINKCRSFTTRKNKGENATMVQSK